MRTLDQLCEAIDTLGIAWANERFKANEEPEPPYIVIEAGFDESAYADNSSWLRWMPYEVLLYTQNRDYATEEKIGNALDKAGIVYGKSVARNDSEGLIEVIFAVNVTE